MSEYHLGLFYNYGHTIISLCIIFFLSTYTYLYGEFYPVDQIYEENENE